MNFQVCFSQKKKKKQSLDFILISPDGAEVQPVGKVSNLRVVEILGRTVRLGWTGVAGATQYRIVIVNTEGQRSRFCSGPVGRNRWKTWFVFLCHVVGTEEIRSIPGNQTTLDLRDLIVGVSYGVSVTALVGEREGDPVTVYIKPGETIVRTNFLVSREKPFSIGRSEMKLD